MKFAQFHAGQIIEAGPYTVTEAQILAFAKEWDPQWFHTDPEAAAQGPHGGLIASGQVKDERDLRLLQRRLKLLEDRIAAERGRKP